MDETLLQRLMLPPDKLESINRLFYPAVSLRAIRDFLAVVDKFGTPEEINQKAQHSSQLSVLLERVQHIRPDYAEALEWLIEQRDCGAFISIPAYRRKVLGESYHPIQFNDTTPVTLEISACQYFQWLIDIARRAIEQGEIMPGRVIRVRNMKEQEADGDLVAFAAAMQIIGASYVEQLDTRGSDGANIHLGGPDTMVGYYGGVGEPNDYPLKWLDEYLYYYTNYGVRQVLNVNSGTVLVGYLLHRIGVDIEFKISVTLGNDNPYSAFWTLLTARLFARQDGSTPLVGFNWSNSTSNETIQIAAQFRKELGLEDLVRFEHHVTETWKGIVIQPYNRRQDLVALASSVSNLGAKHEGGDPEVEQARARPSEIQDYYRQKEEIIASGDWDHLSINFQDKFTSLNRTAEELTRHGLSFVTATHLHRIV